MNVFSAKNRHKVVALLKFRFSEKATKFEKIFVVLLTRASCSVRATAYILVKKSTKIFQNKCGQVVLYKLYLSETSRQLPRGTPVSRWSRIKINLVSLKTFLKPSRNKKGRKILRYPQWIIILLKPSRNKKGQKFWGTRQKCSLFIRKKDCIDKNAVFS